MLPEEYSDIARRVREMSLRTLAAEEARKRADLDAAHSCEPGSVAWLDLIATAGVEPLKVLIRRADRALLEPLIHHRLLAVARLASHHAAMVTEDLEEIEEVSRGPRAARLTLNPRTPEHVLVTIDPTEVEVPLMLHPSTTPELVRALPASALVPALSVLADPGPQPQLSKLVAARGLDPVLERLLVDHRLDMVTTLAPTWAGTLGSLLDASAALDAPS